MISRVVFVWMILGVLLAGGTAIGNVELTDAVAVSAAALDDSSGTREAAVQKPAVTGEEIARPYNTNHCYDYSGNEIPCPVTYCAGRGQPVSVPANQVPADAVFPDTTLATHPSGATLSVTSDCHLVANGVCVPQAGGYVRGVDVPEGDPYSFPGDPVDGGVLGPDCEVVPITGSISGTATCNGQVAADTEIDLVQDMGGTVIATLRTDAAGQFAFTGLPLEPFGLRIASGSCAGTLVLGISLTDADPNVIQNLEGID